MAAILNEATATEYVRDWHARCGETVDVTGAESDTVDGAPFVRVAIILASGDAAEWSVWVESGRLYGEW